MNLRDLKYICAVADLKHFGRAAEYCNISQPTLSGQIKKLENELGVTLFERNYKVIQVTEIGEKVVSLARQANLAADKINKVAIAAQDPLSGSISIGLIPTIAPYLIPLFAKKLRKSMTKMNIRYVEDITDRLVDSIIHGKLDMAVLATSPAEEALTSIELFSEPFWLLYPKNHPLSNINNIQMEDLDQEDLLLLAEGHCFRDQALSICKSPQSTQQQFLQATSLETLINLVISGQGITLIPALAIRNKWNSKSEIIKTKINEKSAHRKVYLTFRKEFSRLQVIDALTEIIRNSLPETVATSCS
jgi:LysR family transcriptional regulator, hydrogen peroxide-inducible genes activator